MNYTLVRISLVLLVSAALSCGSDDQPNIFIVDIVPYLDPARDIKMVAMPGGAYAMGSVLYPALDVDTLFHDPIARIVITDTTVNEERPVHFVSLSPFLISSTEVTQDQYIAVMDSNPSTVSIETDLPVQNIDWFGAVDFCNALSSKLGYKPCYDSEYNCDFSADGFRLPTEAEWEYAARGGTTTEYSFGDTPDHLGMAAWYSANSESRIRRTAEKIANPVGLFDMYGNVFEWCQDYYGFYNCGVQNDPAGPSFGEFKVARGGSWASSPEECRSSKRLKFLPDEHWPFLGFRIVRRP